jgi:NADH dehydrogenase
VLDPAAYGGKTYEVAGPARLSMVELHQAVLAITRQDTEILPMPDLFGSLLSRFGWLPGAPLTRDQWLMLGQDNVPSGELPGLEAIGINSTPLAAVGPEWLDRFQGNRFAGRRVNLTATS